MQRYSGVTVMFLLRIRFVSPKIYFTIPANISRLINDGMSAVLLNYFIFKDRLTSRIIINKLTVKINLTFGLDLS